MRQYGSIGLIGLKKVFLLVSLSLKIPKRISSWYLGIFKLSYSSDADITLASDVLDVNAFEIRGKFDF